MHERIRENKEYFKELTAKVKQIETYYPLFAVYISFIGFYFFEIITTLSKSKLSYQFLILLGFLTPMMFFGINSIWQFILLIKPRSTPHMLIQKDIHEMKESALNDPDNSGIEEALILKAVNERVNKNIEELIDELFVIYSVKRGIIEKMLPSIMYAFIATCLCVLIEKTLF